jgi:hypothetical protein
MNLKKLKEIPLSSNDIRQYLNGLVKVIRYSEIRKYNTIKELLSPYNRVVILYETSSGYGHWVGLFINGDNQIEFFDPYGYFIDDQFNFIDPSMRGNNSGQDKRYLSMLLLKAPPNISIVYNKKPIQSHKNGINSCGRHVIARMLFGDIPLKEYQSFLGFGSGSGINKNKKNYNPDDIITELTSFIPV